jgi:hypothetical protein
MAMKRKPVVFNPDDPFQMKLLEYAESQTNYSSYIKRLIQRDMEASDSPSSSQFPSNANNEPETVWISLTAKGARFIKK